MQIGKSTIMPDQVTIENALKKEQLNLPDLPVIEDIRAEFIEDSSGVDSLEVWVILRDSTRDEELTGPAVVQIKSEIRENLIKNQVGLFPYIRIVRRSDYQSGEGLQ
jgi:hypothetical protein